ncbi:MAG: toxin-antitoxin system YwqK family antitoxin, partial [Saprospiraceae bacterium]
GQTQIIENYVAGHMHGNYEVYYESGLLLLKQNFRMDTLEGISRKYYENGQLEEEVMFADNLENGPFKEYYENGLLHWEGQYLNGDNEFGLLKEYDDMGELIKKMMCDSLAICRTIWTLKEGDITPKY